MGGFLNKSMVGFVLPRATFISPCFLSVKHVMAMCKSVRSKLSLQKQALTHRENLENIVLQRRNTAVLHFLFVLSTCAARPRADLCFLLAPQQLSSIATSR